MQSQLCKCSSRKRNKNSKKCLLNNKNKCSKFNGKDKLSKIKSNKWRSIKNKSNSMNSYTIKISSLESKNKNKGSKKDKEIDKLFRESLLRKDNYLSMKNF